MQSRGTDLRHYGREGDAGLEAVEDVREGPAEDALHTQNLVPRLDQVPERGNDGQPCSHSCLRRQKDLVQGRQQVSSRG